MRLMLLALLLVLAAPAAAREQHPLRIQHADGAIETFRVEWAITEPDREYGLMNRQTIPARTGMLFLYETPGTHAFWMKDTLVSLDMVFFREDGTIVYIHPKAKPLDLTTIQPVPPRQDICAVLELGAGQAALAHLAPGDRIIPAKPSVCLPQAPQ